MKITAIGRQMEVTEDLKRIFEKKLRKFDKFFDEGSAAYITLSRIRGKERLELTISNREMMYRAEVSAETFNNAIDEAIEKIEGQIRKNKTKLKKKLRSEAFSELEAPSGDSEPEEGEFVIRNVKSFEMRPMTPAEAILQMNMLGHHFFMFSNGETGKMSVIYKREDGDYGLIEPM